MFGKKTQAHVDMEIFAFYDSKAQMYGLPHFSANENYLKRDLLNLFRDPQQRQNQLLVNAEDFSIFRIGTYDKGSGMITACNPTHVANLHELRSLIAPDLERHENTQRAAEPVSPMALLPT